MFVYNTVYSDNYWDNLYIFHVPQFFYFDCKVSIFVNLFASFIYDILIVWYCNINCSGLLLFFVYNTDVRFICVDCFICLNWEVP